MPAAPISRIIIQDIPAGTKPEDLVPALNRLFRDLGEQLKEVVVQESLVNVDLGDKRIVKVGDPRDDTDVVNLRTLKRGQGRPSASEQNSTSAGEVPVQHYAID